MYRDSGGRRATYNHGNTTLEIIWTIIPAAILIVLVVHERQHWAKVKRHAPESDFELGVAAKQFNWEVSYPGPDGKLGTDDDVKFDNDLHVPVNKVVRVHLHVQRRHSQFFSAESAAQTGCRPGPHDFGLV